MADSQGLLIEKAVETRLNLASVMLPSGQKTKPAGLVVERERISQVMPEEVADGVILLTVAIGAEVQVNRNGVKSPMTTRTLELLIGIFVDATVEKAADTIDPGYNWIIHALQSDPSLGVGAHFVSEEGHDSEYTAFADADAVVAGRELKIHIGFHTRTDDPTVRNN